jgi:hypothetical protein
MPETDRIVLGAAGEAASSDEAKASGIAVVGAADLDEKIDWITIYQIMRREAAAAYVHIGPLSRLKPLPMAGKAM